MQRKLKIGIVGASWFSDLWYLPVLQKHPHVHLQAICSKTEENAKRMAEKYQIHHVYTDYREMIETEALDGICIITPNNTHKDIALAAVEKGLHVICEKPIALDSNEAGEMYKDSKNRAIVHAVNFTYREHPGVQKLKELVQQGFIGELLDARFEYSGDYGLAGPPGWRSTISSGGVGGVLQDLGSHLIDLAQIILNQRIEKVMGSMTYYENGQVKEISEKVSSNRAADSVSFLAECSLGTRALFFTSWVAAQGNKHQTIEIVLHGAKGTLQMISSDVGTTLRYALHSKPWQTINLPVYPFDLTTEPAEEKFRSWRLTNKNEVWKWIDYILGKRRGELATFRDGYEVQKVIDAVIESASLDRKVSINYTK